LIFGENSTFESEKKYPNFRFVTLRFYVKSNLAILGGKICHFGHFEGPEF